MALRLVQVNIKARDEAALGRFWAKALGWEQTSEGPSVANLEPFDIPLPDPRAVGIDIVAVPDYAAVHYRTHLELADSAGLIGRLINLGATSAGTDGLADPEGNFFSVVEPRDEKTGPIAAVIVECDDPRAMARFWGGASDWTLLEVTDEFALLRSAQGVGPFLEFRRASDRRSTRIHLDLRPYLGDNLASEVARLRTLGATDADIGQGDVPWAVMTDPEGNQFCVLTPG